MGRMHLSLYHTVWPSWVSSRKYEKLKNKEESSSWMLARSLSLKRANERATKAHHRSAGDDEHGSQHRISQSIDELFVLSQLKEYGPDWFSYEDICRGEKEELWRDGDTKESSAFRTSVSSDLKSGLEMKDHNFENKDVNIDVKEKGELCREDDKKDSDELCTEELASMKSKGCDTECELEMEDHDLENKDVKFEDKEIIFDVEGEESKRLSMDDRRARRVSDSLSARLPLEVTSRSVKESIALVRHSFNPYKDFRESVIEMILGSNLEFNNSDLEELLYCYFSLNPPEHHDLIKKVFMDIWLELQAA